MKRQRFTRGILGLLLLLGPLAVVSAVSAGPAAAAHNPCGTYNSSGYFDGYTNYPSSSGPTFYGVSSWMTSGTDFLCTGVPGSNNFTMAWAMIADPSNGGYAQSGQMYYIGMPCNQMFAEQDQTGSGTFRRQMSNCTSTGENHLYWTYYDYVNGSLDTYVDNAFQMSSTFDPLAAGVWPGKWAIELSGETKYPGSDVPGIPSGHTAFTSIWGQTVLSPATWTDACSFSPYNGFSSYNSFSRGGQVGVSCDAGDIWTATP